MKRAQGLSLISLAAILSMLIGAAPSDACTGSQAVSTCGTTCTANCYLQQNINCTTGQGITLNAGFNLDLCGHSITCTSPICYNAGVAMGGNGSKVYNTTSTQSPPLYGSIVGGFLAGVQCNGRSSSQIIGIVLDNIDGTGVQECAKVEGNIFYNSNARSINGVTNSDTVSNNYFQFDIDSDAVDYSTSHNVSIDHNLIVEVGPAGSAGNIIDVHSATNSVDVTDNVFLISSMHNPIYPNTGYGSTFSKNFCNPADTNCQTCISNGACELAHPTFVFP